MAYVIVNLKITPEGIEANLEKIKNESVKMIEEFGGKVGKTEEVPVAFGLKSVNITFSMNEEKGGTEPLEEKIKTIEEVQTVQVLSVSRALG